jgi:hypothetical protein
MVPSKSRAYFQTCPNNARRNKVNHFIIPWMEPRNFLVNWKNRGTISPSFQKQRLITNYRQFRTRPCLALGDRDSSTHSWPPGTLALGIRLFRWLREPHLRSSISFIFFNPKLIKKVQSLKPKSRKPQLNSSRDASSVMKALLYS